MNLITDFNSDEKVIKALNESAPSLVITPHISEADEKVKINRREAHQACKKYLQRVLKSKRELWHKAEGKTDDLSSKYVPVGKKNRRWKDIHVFNYSKGFKHVKFVSAGLRDSISEQEDVDNPSRSLLGWYTMKN